MHSRTNGYGRPIHSFTVVSGVNRCGVAAEGGVQNEKPVVIPTPILRKFFNHFAPPKGAYPENRPELYALGSGISEELIGTLKQGEEFECNVDEYHTPCFTGEEIDRLTARLFEENNLYISLTPEEIAYFNNEGGLAPGHSAAMHTHVAPEKAEAVYAHEYDGSCPESRSSQWGPYVYLSRCRAERPRHGAPAARTRSDISTYLEVHLTPRARTFASHFRLALPHSGTEGSRPASRRRSKKGSSR